MLAIKITEYRSGEYIWKIITSKGMLCGGSTQHKYSANKEAETQLKRIRNHVCQNAA